MNYSNIVTLLLFSLLSIIIIFLLFRSKYNFLNKNISYVIIILSTIVLFILSVINLKLIDKEYLSVKNGQ